MLRFERGFSIINAINKFQDGINQNNAELGTGGIFATRPITFHDTELGYGGTQHRAMVSCEFGHFWVDAKRGQVFQLLPNGKGLNELSNKSMRKWFKEHLPFKIFRHSIPTLTPENFEQSDNALTGRFGITMGWDARHRRVFITKKDWIPTNDGVRFDTRNGGQFKYGELVITDELWEQYFTDVSWTIAYIPYRGLEDNYGWLSYYDFKPNAYIPHNEFFQTLYDGATHSHYPLNHSFTEFYGDKYDWKIELPIKNQFANKVLHSVKYWMDSRRYDNKYDYAEDRCIGFEEAIIYNRSHNSGLLDFNLSTNTYELLKYPNLETDRVQIATTEEDKYWTFNQFENRVLKEKNKRPHWLNDENEIEKFLNPQAITYQKRWPERLRGDDFLIRFTGQNNRHKQYFKWLMTNERLIS